MKYILLVLAVIIPLHSQGIDISKLGGLRFSGNHAKFSPAATSPRLLPIEKRSLFEISTGDQIATGTKVNLEFVFTIWDNRYNGEVLRLTVAGNPLALRYSIDEAKRTAGFFLEINGKPAGYRFNYDLNRIYEGNWFPVKLSIDLRSGALRFSFSGKEEKLGITPKNSREFNLRFGRDGTGNCLPVEIKELKIFADEELRHCWKFNEMSGDVAYDSEGGLDVRTLNCEWVINRHFMWDYEREENYVPPAYYRYSVTEPEHLFFDSTKTSTINLRQKVYTEIPYQDSVFLTGMGSSLPENDSLVAFQTGYPDAPSVLDFRRGNWLMKNEKVTPEGHYYGSWLILDPKNIDVYIFGGYGWYKFKNTLIRFNKSTNRWDTLKTAGEKPNPVHYHSMLRGKTQGEYYFFGGEGNETGNQVDGSSAQWGFYKLDLNTLTWQKKWQWRDTSARMAMVYSVWANTAMTSIYSIIHSGDQKGSIYETARLELDKEELTIVGDPILVKDQDLSVPALYIDHETGKLYSIVYNTEGKSVRRVVKSIRTPVLSQAEYNELLERSTPVMLAKRQKMIGYILIGMVSISIPAAAWAGYRRRVKRKGNDTRTTGSKQADRNFITLFGGLKIVDANGVNIHEQLTHGLSDLFSLIYFHTVFSPDKGIKPDDCAKVIWTDTNEENRLNNRKVFFSKLRRLLNENSAIKLEQRGDFVAVSVPSTYNDELKSVYNMVNGDDGQLSNEKLDRFIQMISRGEFLEGVTAEWVPQTKSIAVSRILKKASEIMTRLRANGEHARVLELARALSKQDPLSEEVLKLKLLSLLDLGENEEARIAYAKFRRDYANRYGEEFPYDLDEFTVL